MSDIASLIAKLTSQRDACDDAITALRRLGVPESTPKATKRTRKSTNYTRAWTPERRAAHSAMMKSRYSRKANGSTGEPPSPVV